MGLGGRESNLDLILSDCRRRDVFALIYVGMWYSFSIETTRDLMNELTSYLS